LISIKLYNFRNAIFKPKLVEFREETKVEYTADQDFSRQESTIKRETVKDMPMPVADESKRTYTKPCIIRLKYKTRFNPSKEVII
jgi:hypothetical protein